MKIKFNFVIFVYVLMLLSATLFAQEELVKGYYDPDQ